MLLGILAAATVCMMDGTRLSWLPAAAWMAVCLLTVLVLLDTVTNGLAQLLDDVLKAWQQLHARNYTSFLAQEDGSVGLTVVLCMLGVLCGLWEQPLCAASQRPAFLAACGDSGRGGGAVRAYGPLYGGCCWRR